MSSQYEFIHIWRGQILATSFRKGMGAWGVRASACSGISLSLMQALLL